MNDTFNQETLSLIEAAIKPVMKKKRLQHTMGVVDAAVVLANKYGAHPFKTAVAALLHDYAKDFSEDELMKYIREYGIETDPVLSQAHELLHGKVAAVIARQQFGVKDKEVLLAIEFHTTGRKGMGLIEKIIYLSDFIELGRDYTGVENLRNLASENLNKAVLQALTNTMIYVLRTGKLLHQNTLEARNEMLMNTHQESEKRKGGLTWKKAAKEK